MATHKHASPRPVHEDDLEKTGELRESPVEATNTDEAAVNHVSQDSEHLQPAPRGRLARWNAKVESLAGLEARGITRVLPEEKYGGGWSSYLQMFTLWFGMNFCAITLIPGLLGPLIFGLGWVDCVCIVIFANALSCCGPAYMATFGPQSGNRTMV